MTNFLDRLELSDEERGKLAMLGAATPFALLSLRQASPEAFDEHIGESRAETIATQLSTLISAAELVKLGEPRIVPGSLGARLPEKPVPKI